MLRLHRENRVFYFIFYILWICVLMFKMPEFNSFRDQANYITLFVANIIIFGHLFLVLNNRGIDFLEPWPFFFLLNAALFVVYPVILIWENNTLCAGKYDVMDGCIWGTIVFIIAYFAFSHSYFMVVPEPGQLEDADELSEEVEDSDNFDMRKFRVIALAGWIFCFGCAALSVIVGGRSFLSIISFGTAGLGVNTDLMTDTPLKFLINFEFSMLGFALYIILFFRSNILKLVVLYLTLSVYIAGGFRFIVLGMLIALGAVYYIRRKSRPPLRIIVIALIVAVLFSTYLGMVRRDLRSGAGMQIAEVQVDDVEYMFYSNLNIYQTYYGVAAKVPMDLPHTFGRATIFDTAIMFIPRSIWSGKPTAGQSASLSTIKNAIHPDVLGRYGMATPYLTEIYLDYTVLGVWIIMLKLAKIIGGVYSSTQYKNVSRSSIIRYCLFLGLFMQLIIRGYFASGFWMVVFAYIPYFLFEKTNIAKP